MKQLNIAAANSSKNDFSGDVLFIIIPQESSKNPVNKDLKKILKELIKLEDFNGKEKESIVVYPHALSVKNSYSAKRVCFIGCGQTKEEDGTSVLAEKYRLIGGEISKISKKLKASSIYITLPSHHDDVSQALAQSITEGVVLGSYTFTKYKKKKEKDDKYKGITKVKVCGSLNQISFIRSGIKLGRTVAKATCDARDMAFEPGNKWTPSEFEKYARKVAESSSLKCTVFDKKQLQSLGMGGILGVNQGSEKPPKMIILDHEPKKYTQTILLVGKGLTFDSGGVSLKPSAGMEDMKYDMCGGAAVIAAMSAIGQEKPNVRVVGIIPSTENMINGAAIKPGDILTHYNGLTSEVINTDAEGRLILADALAYGQEKYKPNCIIDLATLTGAVIVGLGHHYTGLLSNNDKLVELLIASGDSVSEPLWRLPLGEEYTKQIESTVADIKNMGGKGGGTCTAAAYLEKFVNKTPWAHLDIAGTAWNFTEKNYIPKGPSGTGVRTLIDLIRNWENPKL